MSAVHFFDTNVLLYSISRADEEVAKRERAITLLDEEGRGALSAQILQESDVQATRVTRPDPLPHDIAAGLIRTWMRFDVQDVTAALLTQALDLKLSHGFSSFWMHNCRNSSLNRLSAPSRFQYVSAHLRSFADIVSRPRCEARLSVSGPSQYSPTPTGRSTDPAPSGPPTAK